MHQHTFADIVSDSWTAAVGFFRNAVGYIQPLLETRFM
jgi:hypothetical protein